MRPQTPLKRCITSQQTHAQPSLKVCFHLRDRALCCLACACLVISAALVFSTIVLSSPLEGRAEPDTPPDITWSPSVPSVNPDDSGAPSTLSGEDEASSPDAVRHQDASGDVSTTGTTNPGVSPAAEGSSLLPTDSSSTPATQEGRSDTKLEASTTSNEVQPQEDQLTAFGRALLPGDEDHDYSVLIFGGIALGVLVVLLLIGVVMMVKKRGQSDSFPPTPSHGKRSKSKSAADMSGSRAHHDGFTNKPYTPSHFAPKDARGMKDQLMQDMGLTSGGLSIGAAYGEEILQADALVFEKEVTGCLSPVKCGPRVKQRSSLGEGVDVVGKGAPPDEQNTPVLQAGPYQPFDYYRANLGLTGSHFIKGSGAFAVNTALQDTDAYLASCGILVGVPGAAKAHETFVLRDVFDYDPPFESRVPSWRPLEIASIDEMEADAHRDQKIKDYVEHTYHEVAAEIAYLARAPRKNVADERCAAQDDSVASASKGIAGVRRDELGLCENPADAVIHPDEAYDQTPAHNTLCLDEEVVKKATRFTKQPKGFDLKKMFSEEFVEPVHQAESPISRVAQLAIVPETEVPSVEAPSRDQIRRNRSMAIGNTDMFLRAVLESQDEAMASSKVDYAVGYQGVAGHRVEAEYQRSVAPAMKEVSHYGQDARISATSQNRVDVHAGTVSKKPAIAGTWSAPSGRSFASHSGSTTSTYASDFDYVSVPAQQGNHGDALLFFNKEVTPKSKKPAKKRAQLNRFFGKDGQSNHHMMERLRAYWG